MDEQGKTERVQDVNAKSEDTRRSFLKKTGGVLLAAAATGIGANLTGLMQKARFTGVAHAGELPNYEIYALKYGEMVKYPMYLWQWLGNPPLTPHQEVPRVGFYMWLIKGPKEIILFDTGCSPEVAKANHIQGYVGHNEILGRLGLNTEDISKVVISHIHWDHVNGVRFFQRRFIPFYVQEAAFEWAVKKYPKYSLLKKFNIPAWEDVEWINRLMYMGKLKLVTGQRDGAPIEVAPGVAVIRTDGHMMGHQIMVIKSAGKTVVLPSDAAYLYSNLEMNWPVGLCMTDITDGMDAIRICKEQAGKSGIIVPSHDLEVSKKFPEVAPGVFKVL